MTLDLLISEFDACERALARSVRDASESRTSAALLKRSADLLDRIERHVPQTPAERRDKAFFFLRRGMSGAGITAHGRDIDIALALSALPSDVADAPDPSDPGQAAGAAPGSGEGLINYVSASPERVSLIDSDYRYVATSAANARYHGTRPVRMIGLHLSDVIGQDRFERRARPRMDACLAGEAQEYYHRSGTDANPRIQRCQMKPVDMPGLGPMALVYMRDVTEVVMGGIPLEPLLPDTHLDPSDETGTPTGPDRA